MLPCVRHGGCVMVYSKSIYIHLYIDLFTDYTAKYATPVTQKQAALRTRHERHKLGNTDENGHAREDPTAYPESQVAEKSRPLYTPEAAQNELNEAQKHACLPGSVKQAAWHSIIPKCTLKASRLRTGFFNANMPHLP